MGAEIAKLSKRLHRVRHSSTKKGQHLESASALTTTLNTKLKVQTENLSRMFEKEKASESGESNAVDATSQGDDVRNAIALDDFEIHKPGFGRGFGGGGYPPKKALHLPNKVAGASSTVK